MRPHVIGFDLDMTLVDSAVGIAATVRAALAEQGVTITRDRVWPLIGLPLDVTMARLAPQADLPAAVRRYRELYLELGVPPTRALPGAAAALAAVRTVAAGRVLVVSTKIASAVTAVLERVGLHADEVHGSLFAADKAGALRDARAEVYVGDHPADVAAARAADAVAVAVATGPHTAAALDAAGADIVLPGLLGFPRWLQEQRATGPTREVVHG